MRARAREWTMGFALLCAGACGDDLTGGSADVSAVLVRAGGDWQRASGLARLDAPLAIRAIDPVSLAPLAGLAIRFSVVDARRNGASLSDTLAITNRDGMARTELTLGRAAIDTVIVTARAGRGPAEHFTVLVSPAPVIREVVPASMRAGDTMTVRGTGLVIAAGSGVVRFDGAAVRPLWVSDTAVRVVAPPCLETGSVMLTVTNGGARTDPVAASYTARGTPLTLAPLGGTLLRAADLADCVVLMGEGARYLVIAQVESESTTPDGVDAEVRVGAHGGAVAALGAVSAAGAARDATPRAFESLLRARERVLAGAGAGFPAGFAAARAAAPAPVVGDVRDFTVIAALDGSAFATAPTRLRYAGRHIYVWVDTTSPPELADSTLNALARVFDDELYPLDEDAFGETSDVDGNGRVHLVLTPVVNTLTPTTFCTLSGFVSGFFAAYDLYAGTPHANGGEIIYGFVPDSVGRMGCPHPVSEFSRAIRTTFVHELQHAINYQQHVLRRGGPAEEVWLNEGMSHMAEELASKLYERRYPAPFGRASVDQLFPDSSQNFILFNLINAYLFLRQPFVNSLTHFVEGGTLEERGGSWLFLRWLADQYGEDILRRLVQTPLAGKANVADKAGEPFERLAGDFALATYADSLPGLPRGAAGPRWRFRTRNLRTLFQRLSVIASFPPFPIEPLEVPYGGAASGPIRVGGFIVLMVEVPAGASATTLRFAPRVAGVWSAGQSPQVGILRLQ